MHVVRLIQQIAESLRYSYIEDGCFLDFANYGYKLEKPLSLEF